MQNPTISLRQRNTRNLPNQREIVLPGKRFSLSYSRRTHDQRIYNVNHLIPHPFDILVQKCKAHQLELEQARKRIYKTRFNTFRYHPSKDYLKFIAGLKALKVYVGS